MRTGFSPPPPIFPRELAESLTLRELAIIHQALHLVPAQLGRVVFAKELAAPWVAAQVLADQPVTDDQAAALRGWFDAIQNGRPDLRKGSHDQ